MMTADPVPLEEALGRVSKVFGVQVIASTTLLSQDVRLIAPRAGLAGMLDSIAEQAGAVAVVRGWRRTVELVPTADSSGRRFSSRASEDPEPHLSVAFERVDAVEALRMVAGAVNVDVVVPRGLSGRVSGTFTDVSWKEVVRAIAGPAAAPSAPDGPARSKR